MTQLYRKLFFDKTNNKHIHLLRSIIASSVSFLLDFITLVILVEIFTVYYVYAGIIGFVAGTSLLYFLSVSWIFTSRRINNKFYEYLIFIFLGLIGGFLNILILWLLTDKIGIYYIYSRLIAATLVFFFNFIGRKIILFTKK